MDVRFAERAGEELVRERKMIASLMEAAVHGRTVAFLCPTMHSAVNGRYDLVKMAKSLGNRYAEPTFVTREEVYFKSGGCVRFVVNKNSRYMDGFVTDEVMWI